MDKYPHTPEEAAKAIRESGGEDVYRESSITTRAAWGRSLNVETDDFQHLDEQFGLNGEDETPV